ncbi:ROK family transcriptional regulator [Actinopolymorpha sp. B17G11]|uniref:ROK family transcriptional regulator n=1 Tax=Actinopolymorpha sp. B17G11 TaxID=3160861 RepID=UPI0032E476F0
MTDRTVMDHVFTGGRVTRVELSRLTGISKPTISESVRRLEAADLLEETGVQTGRPGRVATYYELSPTAGWVLGLQVSQEGVLARCADLAGGTIADRSYSPVPGGDVRGLVRRLRKATKDALATPGPLRAIAMSVANPVDPANHEIIALSGSPFPEGLLDPRQVFDKLTDAPLLVGNDVNLAVLAERRDGDAGAAESVAYVYLGAGLGMSLYVGDNLVRGANGLAGEIGYLPDISPSGQTLVGVFDRLGFTQRPATTLDVDRILATLDAGTKDAGRVHDAVARVVAVICAVVNPELVLLGGPIGSHPGLIGPVRAAVAGYTPTPVRIERPAVAGQAPLAGAVHRALDHARELLFQNA